MFYTIQLLLLLFQGNPGNGGGGRACETPNPPFWCNEQVEPGAPIDQYILYFIIIAVIIGIYIIWKYKKI